MKNHWNIYFTIQGPAGMADDVPNNSNPVECANMASLLRKLMDNLPSSAMGMNLEVIGLRIEQVEEPTDEQG